MDVVKAVEAYVTKMVQTPNAIKVLLLDSDTLDANRVFGVNTEYSAIPASVSDGQNRQF